MLYYKFKTVFTMGIKMVFFRIFVSKSQKMMKKLIHIFTNQYIILIKARMKFSLYDCLYVNGNTKRLLIWVYQRHFLCHVLFPKVKTR